ncbi:hypothetical protein L6164_035666 [Bauhinia variegata]|uniref:Uncharacterized protein n=1 Tax=Bauhinia variegata TaxID=167791 RepID=A0ACB9KEN7_BAUVA|nr:hypothetical protein L6164_035666 [Bauhinia variegata]
MSCQASNRGYAVAETQALVSPPPSTIDVKRLCQEGKVNEEIKLMDKGVKTDADERTGFGTDFRDFPISLSACAGAEAVEEYIEKLPFEPTVTVWETLRNYARIHGDIDLKDHVEELMVSLEPSKVVANMISTPTPKKRHA